MRHIPKKPGNEPRTWIDYRTSVSATDAAWKPVFKEADALPKDDLRHALAIEQGYLCAFCMAKLHYEYESGGGHTPTFKTRDETKVAHLQSQNAQPGIPPRTPAAEQLEKDRRWGLSMRYDNLVLACPGHTNKDADEETAVPPSLPGLPQPRKKQRTFSHCDASQVNADIVHVRLFDRAQMARIKFGSDGTIAINDPNAQREIDKTLALNHPSLMKRRAVISNQLEQEFALPGAVSKAAIRAKIAKYRRKIKGRYEAYCQVAIYTLTQFL